MLITHPKLADAAVFGVPNDDLGEEVKAVVQPMPEVEPRRPGRRTARVLLRAPIPAEGAALDRFRGPTAATSRPESSTSGCSAIATGPTRSEIAGLLRSLHHPVGGLPVFVGNPQPRKGRDGLGGGDPGHYALDLAGPSRLANSLAIERHSSWNEVGKPPDPSGRCAPPPRRALSGAATAGGHR